MEGGEEWLQALPGKTLYGYKGEDIQRAIGIASGSGAGGRFTETGFAATSENPIINALMSNRLTRRSQRRGERVEGAVRLGDGDGLGGQGRGRPRGDAPHQPHPLRLLRGVGARRQGEADHPVLDVHVAQPADAVDADVLEATDLRPVLPRRQQLLRGPRAVHPRVLAEGRGVQPGDQGAGEQPADPRCSERAADLRLSRSRLHPAAAGHPEHRPMRRPARASAG